MNCIYCFCMKDFPTAFSPLRGPYSPHQKKKVFKGPTASAIPLRWFASDTTHIVFIHIPSAMKLCFYRFVDFHCVLIYVFCFHHKQRASDYKNFSFLRFTSQLFSSADESLKDETRLPLLWHGSLVTLHTLCSCIYHLWCSQFKILRWEIEFLKAV